MDRRGFVLGALLLGAGLPFFARAAFSKCPLCAGAVVSASDLADDLSRPSRNLDLWSRAADCLAIADEGGPVCTRCWYVFRSGNWSRSSERADDFHVPLGAAVATFPVPERHRSDGRLIYRQILLGADGKGGAVEEIAFWARGSARYRAAIRRHAEVHGMRLEIEAHPREPGQIYIVAEFDPRPQRTSAD